MGSGINNKTNEFFFKPENVKKRRNTRLEKCCGHVNIATAFQQTGIYPFNRDVFYETEFEPAAVTDRNL